MQLYILFSFTELQSDFKTDLQFETVDVSGFGCVVRRKQQLHVLIEAGKCGNGKES